MSGSRTPKSRSKPQNQTYTVVKVWRTKGGRAIPVTKLMPKSWDYVIITVLKKGPNELVLKLEPVRKQEFMDDDRYR